MRSVFLGVLVLAGSLAGTLHAQRLSESRFLSLDQPPPVTDLSTRAFPRREGSPALLVGGGVLGGVAGLFTGAIVGGRLTEHDCEDCGIVGVVYGGIAGWSAGIPLGVHLANGRRGSYGLSLLSSLAIGGLGLAVASETNSGLPMLSVPVLQIVTSILIERKTERLREAP